MIQGIFYARFLPQEGTKIVAQSPPGCIVASPDAPNLKPPLLDFDIIQEYVIPRKAFFNRFITVDLLDDKYSVLGFPVAIADERYHRNEFLFNFGLVLESDVDQIPYERLVRRLAVTFAEMERQNGYLSSEGTANAAEDGRRPIESLLEIIKEDLNNYGECMIPIDEANTLNMKLFPHQAAPAAVRGWHVPVPKVKLAEIVDPTWDLTLQRIIPHVDGVNDVRRIAWLADVSLPLAQVALRHLLYYDTVLLLDMFFFSSCYAPRPTVHDFVANRDGLVDECAAYVCLRPPPPPSRAAAEAAAAAAAAEESTAVAGSGSGSRKASGVSSGAGSEEFETKSGGQRPGSRSKSGDSSAATITTIAATAATPATTPATTTTTTTTTTKGQADGPPAAVEVVTHYQLIKLMTTFCVGRSVMEWVKLHRDAGFDVLRHVDVRRLVQFGVIKGLLYRVHKYVVSKRYLRQLATGQRVAPSSSAASGRGAGGKGGKGGTGGGGGGGGGSGRGRAAAAAAWPDGDDGSRNNKKAGHRGDAAGRNTSHARDDGGRGGGGGGGGGGGAGSGAGGKGKEVNRSRGRSTDYATNGRYNNNDHDGGGGGGGDDDDDNDNDPLRKYTDGTHCFDQIITEQNMTDTEIMEKLKSLRAPPGGDLTVFYR